MSTPTNPEASSGQSSRSGGMKRPRDSSPEPPQDEKPLLRLNDNIFEEEAEPGNNDNNETSEPSGAEADRKIEVHQNEPNGSEAPTNQDTKVKVCNDQDDDDPNAGAANRDLLNFFEFSSKTLPQVLRAPKRTEEGPAPKLPRVAHYNQHNEEDEVKYVEEFRTVRESTKVTEEAEESSEDEDKDGEEFEDDVVPAGFRYFRTRQEVFNKYDFESRTIDVSNLAAYKMKDKIIETLEKNPVVIIEGFTGCGKTTQIPQIIIDRAYEQKRPCNVIVTQPRRLAAVAVARRVCEERSWEVGSVVGYQVGLEKKVSPDTLVTFMTVGVLLQRLTKSRNIRNYTHIIIDEVHERDLHTDLLLLFIKKILMEDQKGMQRHVKLILMSATLNADQFSTYFTLQRNSKEKVAATPVVKIPSAERRFHVDEIFLDQLGLTDKDVEDFISNLDKEKAAILPEMYRYAVQTIVSLDHLEAGGDPRLGGEVRADMKQKNRGSVLVFLPGIMEIKVLYKLLEEESRLLAQTTHDPNFYKWEIVPLHSSITNEEQRKVFMTPKDYHRKIIISTNIAESSITVPDIVYVIDFCLTKSNCVDARTNFSCLRVCWASIQQCIQRSGRTGRVRDGKCYRMIPRKFFGELEQEAVPEMLKSALEGVALQIKILNMGSPKEILSLALNPPEVSGIERAVANLKEVGALTVLSTRKTWTPNGPHYHEIYDTCDGDVTFLGEIMSSLPISPQCTRLIMLGHCFGVLREAIIIAAGLSGKSAFSTPFNKQMESYLQRLNWAKKSYSDCFAILYAYKTWLRQFGDSTGFDGPNRNQREKQWSRTHFVQIPQMREMRSMIEDIEERLKKVGIFPVTPFPDTNADTVDISKEVALMLKITIAGAFYPNYFYRPRPSESHHERDLSREVHGLDLFSTVYYKGLPPGHNGMLYAKHVAENLSHGLSFPSVKFIGQKVLAIFDGNGKKIGPIAEGVYRAVKKRQIREQLEFKLLWKDDETVEYQKRVEEQRSKQHRKCPPQMDLPGVTKSCVKVAVCHAESPGQFWVIPEVQVPMQNYMAALINQSFENMEGKLKKDLPRLIRERDLAVGTLVLAPYTDESNNKNYYRAKVQLISNLGKALVYFIDYGNSDWVSNRELFDLSETMVEKNLHTTPGLAVECRLSETKPAVIHGSVYPEAAIKAFKDYVANMEIVELKIYAVHQSVIIAEMTKCGQNAGAAFQQTSFNDWLKQNNFADHTPEPYLVTLNHEARQRLDMMLGDDEQIKGHNKRQVAEALERDYVDPPMYGKIPCTLKGPMSPLEIQFQPLCYSSCTKAVNMDNSSVNSVVLDQNPTCPVSRLLISSSINIQERSGRVVARETTMMPGIPGMLSLMSLVFTPKAELRCDPRMKRYTGVLCGLGVDPEKYEPIYMDHDLEVVFDTEIDDKDIELINHIRYDMNVILKNNCGSNTNSIHRDLCEKMFELLKRNRPKVGEEIWPAEAHVWGRLPQRAVIAAPQSIFPSQPLDIFEAHSTIQLNATDPNLMSWDFAV